MHLCSSRECRDPHKTVMVSAVSLLVPGLLPDIAPLFFNGFHGGRNSCGTGFSWDERPGAKGPPPGRGGGGIDRADPCPGGVLL